MKLPVVLGQNNETLLIASLAFLEITGILESRAWEILYFLVKWCDLTLRKTQIGALNPIQ